LRHDSIMIPARRIIVRKSDVPMQMFTLYDGWAFRFVLLPDGRRQILSFLLPGDLIGIQAIYGDPLRFSVQALTDVTLCAFNAKEIAEAMQKSPAQMKHLVARSIREAADADNRVIGLGRRTATERVAGLILKLTNALKRRKSVPGENFAFPLRQEHIADALGLTAVHVSRTISILRDEGAISLERNILTIRDRQRLTELADHNEALALT